jgi:hypothetical protein
VGDATWCLESKCELTLFAPRHKDHITVVRQGVPVDIQVRGIYFSAFPRGMFWLPLNEIQSLDEINHLQ